MENQNFLTNTPVKVQIEDELAKSRVKMSKARTAKTTDIYPKKMAYVFLVALTTEHNETLDAEKHGSSVSPAGSGRTSCVAILIMYV